MRLRDTCFGDPSISHRNSANLREQIALSNPRGASRKIRRILRAIGCIALCKKKVALETTRRSFHSHFEKANERKSSNSTLALLHREVTAWLTTWMIFT